MRIDVTGNRLLDARQVPSPNCDERPDGDDISLIVIHGISLPPGEYGGAGIDDLFTNRLDPDAHPYFPGIAHLRVSSHVLIRRDGEVVQYVPFRMRAWHAGESCYQGRSCCNDYSIGIELEGQDNEPYSLQQYDRLAAIIRVLSRTFPGISSDRIRGHSDIAPGRKTDPGEAFDWLALNERLATLST
ncbi:MAG: 1,6-anhydro-N-acetylmuramyl-L-alanine amidase AmpD [Gammaproteobacteria bacterium]